MPKIYSLETASWGVFDVSNDRRIVELCNGCCDNEGGRKDKSDGM